MSQRNSEYAPVPGDLYCTPAWVTEALFSVEAFSGDTIWEPASGRGHIGQIIRDHLYATFETDITDESAGDFLERDKMIGLTSSIVTNPPYSNGLAEKFVRHALDLTKPVSGKVAMLLPLAWDSAKGRRDIFADHPAFKAKYVLTKRIRWANLPQKKNGPSQNHAWYVWDWSNHKEPTIGYIE